jgi:crotonobetainyl-CoA:carnitine CoA-transferase CaiB-like acyl-CoA transferase
MGRPELANDPRFDSNSNRSSNYDALNEAINQWTTQHTLNEIVELLRAKGLPVAPILNIDEVLALPHVVHRQVCVELDDPLAGKVKVQGSPIKFSRTPCVAEKSAPRIGENTREILTELGYPEERINQLAKNGIIKVV